jgi:hypothetical protein
MIGMFITTAGVQRSAILLNTLPNGDWQNTADVEHYLPAGSSGPADAASIAHALASGMATALCPVPPPEHRADKWTGAKEATAAAGIGIACCNIFPGAMRRFCIRKGTQLGFKKPKVGGLHAATMRDDDLDMDELQIAPSFDSTASAAHASQAADSVDATTAAENHKDEAFGSAVVGVVSFGVAYRAALSSGR